MSTIGVVSFLLFADYFASYLSSDILVIQETALYLRFVMIFIYIAMLQGIGKPAIIMPVSIYRQVLAPIVVLSAFAWMDLGILSVWIGLDIIIFSSALFLWWYGKKQLRILA